MPDFPAACHSGAILHGPGKLLDIVAGITEGSKLPAIREFNRIVEGLFPTQMLPVLLVGVLDGTGETQVACARRFPDKCNGEGNKVLPQAGPKRPMLRPSALLTPSWKLTFVRSPKSFSGRNSKTEEGSKGEGEKTEKEASTEAV